MKVLVTGAGALLGQGIIKCLRLAQHPYEIIAADPDPRAVGLFWADRAHLIPLAADPDYMARVRDIIALERPAALLVGTDVELAHFAANREALAAAFGVHVIVSPPGVIEMADDKWLTNRFLSENGFPHPLSALPADVDSLLANCDFPFIVKPRVGARSAGVHLVRNEAELHTAVRQVQSPIIQECVATATEEFTSGVLLVENEVHAIVTMRRDLRDGNTYRAYVQPASPFNETLAKIAVATGGNGPLNVQFRVDNGVPKIFEINARFSGTTPFRAYAGFNEVDVMLRQTVLGEPVGQPRIAERIILRYWQEMVIDAAELDRLEGARRFDGPQYDTPLNL